MHLEVFQPGWWEQALLLLLAEHQVLVPVIIRCFCSPGPWLSPHIHTPVSPCQDTRGQSSTVLWGSLSVKLPSHRYFFLWLYIFLVFLDFQLCFSSSQEGVSLLLCNPSLHRSQEIGSRQQAGAVEFIIFHLSGITAWYIAILFHIFLFAFIGCFK